MMEALDPPTGTTPRASTGTAGRPRVLFEAASLAFRAPANGRRPVLDGVSLALSAGEIVDITGPSGSGKTTLLRALARLLPDATGTMRLEDVPAERIDPQTWRTQVTLVPQISALGSGAVRESVLVPWKFRIRAGLEPPEDDVVRGVLDSVGLEEVELDRDVAALSVGQAARIALLRVTLTVPKVLLLDEPDANLDEDSSAQVADMTRAFVMRGSAVVRVRHRASDGLASRRLRLADGHLAEVS